MAPGSDFSWFRSRILGGRTNHYGRVTLRLADYDFKPKTTDGLGFDWPISYEDLSPYYDKAERFIGVTGTPSRASAARRTASFNRRRRSRRTTVLVQRSCAKLGIRAVPSRQAVITVRRTARPLPLLRPVRPRLHDRVELRGELRADLPGDEDRPRAGRRQRDGARAHHRRRGKVTAVSYIDKSTGSERQVRCRTVVLAASACESARLLLNSKSSRHPQGLRTRRARSAGT